MMPPGRNVRHLGDGDALWAGTMDGGAGFTARLQRNVGIPAGGVP
jgi:hypothetical protein